MTLALHGASVSGRLHDATLELHPGKITAICGPNGAGKSTLLTVLAGLLKLDKGHAELDGAPLEAIPARSRAQAIGYLPQNAEVAWDIDVTTLTALGRLPWRGSPAEDRAAIADALAATDLTALAHRPISKLSGGERARALLARVLAGRPRWIFADEPLAALDLAHQSASIRTFRALANEGVGVVLVLHDLPRAMNGADRVVVLDMGWIVADGPPPVALSGVQIARTWGVPADWIGEPGHRALALG